MFKIKPQFRSKKLIGVFDTTFWGPVPLNKNDTEAFIGGIIQLLDDNDGLAVLFKMKHTIDQLSKIYPDSIYLYNKLLKHPHCLCIVNYEFDTFEVIAVSDLVISASFTSPTIEAAGAKTRGIYYDATCKFSGSYYNILPNFVANNYNELKIELQDSNLQYLEYRQSSCLTFYRYLVYRKIVAIYQYEYLNHWMFHEILYFLNFQTRRSLLSKKAC